MFLSLRFYLHPQSPELQDFEAFFLAENSRLGSKNFLTI